MLTIDKRVLIVGGVVLLVIIAALSLLFGGGRPVSGPTLLETASPTPSFSPTVKDPRTPPDESVDDGLEAFTGKFPIADQLPHYTPYWGLQIDGEIKDGKIPLRATIYYKPGADVPAVTESQKPYIEAFIKSVNQPDGTYQITYGAKLVERD
jgi:hypothetical protein